MQCQVCKDTTGPFEFEDYKNRVILVCEDCGKKIRKENKKRDYTSFTNPLKGRKV